MLYGITCWQNFPHFADGDFSEEKLKDIYNGDLANGLGNLVSRVAKLCENSGFEFSSTRTTTDEKSKMH